MRAWVSAFVLSLAASAASFAGVQEAVERADSLYEQGAYRESLDEVLAASDASAEDERGQLYWRAARASLELGNDAEKEKKPSSSVLKIFKEGEHYADKAIEADPNDCQGYFWKAANMGRGAQVKGVLDSLNRADPIKKILLRDLELNPDHSEAYFVLGQFYRELPGWPLSYGNVDNAVSLGRKAIDLRVRLVSAGTEKGLVYGFYAHLAKSLYKRNWTAEKRVKEQKEKRSRLDSAKNLLELSFAYEGAVELADMSDREEAKSLLQWEIGELENMESRTAYEENDLRQAREILSGL